MDGNREKMTKIIEDTMDNHPTNKITHHIDLTLSSAEKYNGRSETSELADLVKSLANAV